ncbi:hypothetical protein IKF15_00335 [Candidatus Saccharibacteria bacterium]|nr:hypothetical protein [Candidatus Saccharibacteria bacterium]
MAKNTVTILHTITNPQKFRLFKRYEIKRPNGITDVRNEPVAGAEFELGGGANRAQSGIITPQGILVELDADTYDWVSKTARWQTFVKEGHIKVVSNKSDKEKVLKDMNPKDGSAMKTAADDLVGDVVPVEGEQGLPIRKEKFKEAVAKRPKVFRKAKRNSTEEGVYTD